MKHNTKEIINIVEMGQAFVENLNKSCKAHDMQEFYEVTIKDGKLKSNNRVGTNTENENKPYKTLRFVVVDLETNERLTLFSTDYVFKNPAKMLGSDYKRVLYREFMYACFSVSAFTLKNNIRAHNAEMLLKRKAASKMEEGVPDVTASDFSQSPNQTPQPNPQ